jgi:TB2/DP1, HVA22 family
MRDLDWDKLTIYGVAIACVLAVTPFLHKIPRRFGRSPFVHVAYILVAGLCLYLVPDWIQHEIFSPGGVLVIGTVVPIYESILAVCSIDSTDDDKAWLQFWIASGTFSFCTEFMDSITQYLPQAGEHWYEFEFIVTAWLMLPLTDGSGLMYDYITKPYIAPATQTLKRQMDGYMNIILTMINTSYLWFIWFVFAQLPEPSKRFLVVCLGTVYPMVASTASITSSQSKVETLETSFWLTYWACFSILFILMDYIENFIGHIVGFYSLIAAATLYLFLPMFRGAEVVFRRVLVPLSGQYENLLLHDALLIKIGMEGSIPPAHRQRVLGRAAAMFGDNNNNKKTTKTS